MIARFKKMIRVLERGIYMGKNCVFLDPNSTLLFNILTTRTSINLQHSDINFTSRQKYRESCDLNSICRIIANKIYSHKKYKYTIYLAIGQARSNPIRFITTKLIHIVVRSLLASKESKLNPFISKILSI